MFFTSVIGPFDTPAAFGVVSPVISNASAMSVPAVEVSTYAFVAASVLPVGVASPVIFWLLIVISPVELIFNAPGELILPNAPLPVTLRDLKYLDLLIR